MKCLNTNTAYIQASPNTEGPLHVECMRNREAESEEGEMQDCGAVERKIDDNLGREVPLGEDRGTTAAKIKGCRCSRDGLGVDLDSRCI